MKKFTVLLLLLTITAACSQPTNQKTPSEKTAPKEQSNSKKDDSERNEVQNENQVIPVDFQTSTYDDPELADRISNHRESLKKLSDNQVFAAIQAKLIQKMNSKHRDYFKSKSDYELLAFAKGNLFRENKTDCGFIVYDTKNQRVSILVYRESTNNYAELFRELNVENGLEDADCNYGSFGTIDFQLADEIIYQEEYLFKDPERYLENVAIKITDISKDEDFILKAGCFSKKSVAVEKKDPANALGIATSYVYNNWEALKYNEKTNSFIIFYGQAFAD